MGGALGSEGRCQPLAVRALGQLKPIRRAELPPTKLNSMLRTIRCCIETKLGVLNPYAAQVS